VGGDVRFPADGSPPLVDADFDNGKQFFIVLM